MTMTNAPTERKIRCYLCGSPAARGRKVCCEHVDQEDERKARLAGLSLDDYRAARDEVKKQKRLQQARLSHETKAQAIERLLGEFVELGWPAFSEDPETHQSSYTESPEGWHIGFPTRGATRTPFLRNVPHPSAGVFDKLWLEGVEIRTLEAAELIVIARARISKERVDYEASLRKEEEIRAQAAASAKQRLRRMPHDLGVLGGLIFRAREEKAGGNAAVLFDLLRHEKEWATLRRNREVEALLCVSVPRYEEPKFIGED
jgi:hypothetical protein